MQQHDSTATTDSFASMPYEEILYEVDDPVATITLNRPDKLNAWTRRMEVEVRDAIGQAERDPAVVGIVITGAGRGFCAGADLGALQGLTRGEEPDASALNAPFPGEPSWGDDFRSRYTYLLSVPKPVIAAINGACAGMAVPLVLCCDLRVMAEDAPLTTAFAERGLIAEWGTSWLLPRLVGPAVALDLLLSARRITGHEAAAIGLVNHAMPSTDVVAWSRAYVEDLARRCSPASMSIMKRQVYQQLHTGLGAAEQEAHVLMRETFGHPDFVEGVASFSERRAPSFQRVGS